MIEPFAEPKIIYGAITSLGKCDNCGKSVWGVSAPPAHKCTCDTPNITYYKRPAVDYQADAGDEMYWPYIS
jgi:hypothetical protein